MLVFLSTTASCRVEPDLLSIALVTANGDEFYAERIDFNPENCSIYAEERFLPLMGLIPDAACTLRNLRRRLAAWLRELRDPATVVCTDHAEWQILLDTLGPHYWKTIRNTLNGHLPMPDLDLTMFERMLAYRSTYPDELPLDHALTEARCSRVTFNQRTLKQAAPSTKPSHHGWCSRAARCASPTADLNDYRE